MVGSLNFDIGKNTEKTLVLTVPVLILKLMLKMEQIWFLKYVLGQWEWQPAVA
jgi:hypothetical protein